ncbi:excinuclease ABC subunit UvrC [Candidatus Peregrinibacteria bacterium]|nr:excinuclease ABC subunit UvrC [Candidatus Peregrinibacteria bacterium]
MLSEKLKKSLRHLPSTPGVYEMLSEDGDTLYVGKAKNLRKRVQTYFRVKAVLSLRIQKMIEKTHDIFWTEVSSEVEALILESNLIKEKRPKFNILLRDDKSYAYFCVSIRDDFPQITLTRHVIKDGSLYFGPKISAGSVRKTIDLLRDIFLLRTTNLEITEISPGKVEVKNPGNIKYPCINFHIKKCSAPCIGNIFKEEYRSRIQKAIKFLKGDTKEVLADLEKQMQESAEKREFEKAARVRDLFRAVESISEKQIVSAPDEFSADVIGTCLKFGHAFFHLFQIREGKVINSETFSLSMNSSEDSEEALFAFLREHSDRAADIPKTLVLSLQIFPKEEQEIWEKFFQEKWHQKIEISLPEKGKRKKLLELAEKNAESYAIRNAASFLKHEEDLDKVLETLQKKLKMKHIPKRIECYDVSHFGGTETVASMAVFVEGEEKNAEYRRFQLKTIAHGEINDFKSMEEVILRRLKHIPRQMPDGWKVQKVNSKKDMEFIVAATSGKNEGANPNSRPNENFIILKNGEKIIGILERKPVGATLAVAQSEEIQISWMDSKLAMTQKSEVGYFLVRKLLEISESKKIFFSGVDDDRHLENLGFIFENECWVFKNLSKKKKYDSLKIIPDLLVIDGGKGQLSSAKKILDEFPFAKKIQLCSLAKQFEEVYITGNSKPLAITADSPEGKLLQRIRDEAHRFAITYNADLHKKSQQKSVLDDLPGIGTKTKKKLLQAFGSISGIRDASDEKLLEIVSEKVLREIKKGL